MDIMMGMSTDAFLIALVQIIAIDIVLGGDNAIIIALACRNLPPEQKRLGIIWGTAGAIILRVILVFFASTLMTTPGLRLVGGLLLLWIGVKLLTDQGDQLAVQRTRNKRHQLRLNQAPLVRASDLATALPTVVFDPNTILLVLGEPERRRRFLNWGLFHVKPHFAESWRSWSRALDQRNRLLKVGYASDSLKEWTALLVKYSETIDFWRQQYVEGLQTAFVQLIAQLGIDQPLTLEYRRGWPQD